MEIEEDKDQREKENSEDDSRKDKDQLDDEKDSRDEDDIRSNSKYLNLSNKQERDKLIYFLKTAQLKNM